MCGIFGFLDDRNDALLRSMGDSIKHRGPDADGYFFDNTCSLGMCRLSIVDLQSGNQPVFSKDGRVAAVFNGEIYNFRALRQELENMGYTFKSSHSDSEIIPNLYLEYGADFAAKINGMFAIAIYDRKKGKLLLIRDRIGKKPLYYAQSGARLYFSSEIKALRVAGFGKSIREESLYSYLMKRNTTAPFTIYEDVMQLEPASILEHNEGIVKQRHYWKIDFNSRLILKNEEEYCDLLLEALSGSVRRRMDTDVEFGSYLSGGVDSSLISALLVKAGVGNLKTFTLTYDEDLTGKNEDRRFAAQMSKILGTEHFEYHLTAEEVFRDLPLVLKAFDEPFAGVSSTFFITKLISSKVRVAFSGDGADELFGSYLTHRLSNPMEYLHHFSKLPDFSSLSKADLEMLAPYGQEREYAYLQSLYDRDNLAWREKLLVFTHSELERLFTSRISYSPLKRASGKNKLELNQTLESEFRDQLPNQVLVFVDRLSMAHSVEVRSPFLDYEFVELAAAIPAELKIKNGEIKYIIRKAAERVLPSELVRRKKEGFVLPNYSWIEGAFYDKVRSEILDSGIFGAYGLNRDYVEELLIGLKAGKHHGKVWVLFILAVWHQNRGIK